VAGGVALTEELNFYGGETLDQNFGKCGQPR